MGETTGIRRRRERSTIRSWAIPANVIVILVVTLGLYCPPAGAQSRTDAPGVTATQITTGYIGTLTGPLAADNAAFLPGVRAYFDMVNAHGGINGRKLVLGYALDDEGNPTRFGASARTLIQQDGVFAVTGVSTDFFSPNVFKETGTPTYGYNTTGGWAGARNLFAVNGSVQCYTCVVPNLSWLTKQLGAKSVALIAYNVSASSALCSTVGTLFRQAGIPVSYEDLNAPIDGNITPDVERMQRAGSDFVLSCMDVTGDISMARAIQQYGLKLNQLWLNGSDQSVLNQYATLMQHVYFLLQYVPLTAPLSYYPGLAAYLAAMKKYEPAYVGSDLAPLGWESAALFAAGVQAAGSDLTQQRVIQLTNQLTHFTGDGMTTLQNWTVDHDATTYPNCTAFAKVKGSKLVPIYPRDHQVFVCSTKGQSVKHPVAVTPPPGTPGT